MYVYLAHHARLWSTSCGRRPTSSAASCTGPATHTVPPLLRVPPPWQVGIQPARRAAGNGHNGADGEQGAAPGRAVGLGVEQRAHEQGCQAGVRQHPSPATAAPAHTRARAHTCKTKCTALLASDTSIHNMWARIIILLWAGPYNVTAKRRVCVRSPVQSGQCPPEMATPSPCPGLPGLI